jgi:hypothetical protein
MYTGLLCLSISNFIYNREQRLLIDYLQVSRFLFENINIRVITNLTPSGSLSFFAEHFYWFADFLPPQLHIFSPGAFPEDRESLHIIQRGRRREEQRWAGGGGGAQRPVLRVNEPKKTAACSETKPNAKCY